MQHLTIHIALDDETDANGVLRYVPGSHKFSSLAHATLFLDYALCLSFFGVPAFVLTRRRRWPLLPVTSRHFNDMESIRTHLTESQLEGTFLWFVIVHHS